ncbi:uncharacterized protein LOC127443624 isoform X2 [Myxocyprinus asiaticus]|uniref:uncharacterized protein LOC127443624 isoform X2 n=1 Tax=Myxocyprinus asiaticus TaxID=70543 RepID=UPI00222289F6|nr:uncharacterized protein LOC127443624 isoform X2 [Myxocyprinus asiaticus]
MRWSELSYEIFLMILCCLLEFNEHRGTSVHPQLEGFESILEGIYGPRLLQDLNIFDECEPEDVDDWSMDANCSFCNLHLEKLNDCPPSVIVPGSPTPAESPPPQGLSTSDKLQCQADRFLHAIFRKKEFPQSCDSSVPLVAQDLMRQMIRQFALEYACKSQAHEGLNGLCDNSDLLPHEPDPDGPLDLSRASQALQQYGVLDLSKKNTSSENASTQVSGSLGPNEEDHSRLGKDDGSKVPEVWRVTVLEKVMSSLCSHHRLLLYHILMDMQEDYNISVTLRDAHRQRFKAEPLCFHADKKIQTLTLSDCSETAGICCRTACRVSACMFTPMCVCLKNIHGHSCQNIAMACVGKVNCCNSTVCCTKISLCQHQNDQAYISYTRGVPVNSQNDCNSHNGSKGSRSPSPPPLSPKPVDTECKMNAKTSISHIQDCKVLNMAPPPLLPHRTEFEETALYSNTPHMGSTDEHSKKVLTSHTQAEKENDHQCGSLIGDLMDRVTEKLKSIQPSEKEQTIFAHANQMSKTSDDTHLTEIITTVLHNSSDKDYNLNELLQQHVATEQRSPQTRFRKRLETLEAMSKSPDLPSSRRKSLQIKRDLARLSPSYCRRKIGFERERCPKSFKPPHPTHSDVEQFECSRLERVSKTVDTKLLKDTCDNLTTRAQTDETQHNQEEQETQPQHVGLKELLPPPDEKAQSQTAGCHWKAKAKTHEEKRLTVEIGRSRRNIVPPQRFSSYVTEPRKMYFAACFSESIFIKHSPTDGTSTALGIREETVSDEKPFKIEDENQDCDILQKMASLKDDISSKEKPLYEDDNDGKNHHKLSSRKRKTCQNSTSPSKRSKPNKTNSPDTDSHSPTIPMSNSTTTENVKHVKESHSGLKYDSPIKLMFVSTVRGEDGVKYTLKAAASGSNSHGEMFDPCLESSWAGSAIDEHVHNSVIEPAPWKTENSGKKCTSPKEVASLDIILPSCSNSEGVNRETIPTTHQTTPVKRRPGRPKKLGPQIEKSVKRPIGRPPKFKTIDSGASRGKTASSMVNHRTSEMSCKDDRNKNLKITIVYGRSRRARRVVSDDLDNFPAYQHVYEVCNSGMYSKTCSGIKGSNDEMTKDQFKDLNCVMPVEERKCTIHTCSNIKCQRPSETAVSRKPGRPPKVKISGISVTVTAESPRQRKIHMKRDTKSSHLLRRTLPVEPEPSKEQKMINIPTDVHTHDVDALKEHCQSARRPLIPVRHSVRERKPSIHLLHSVATARSCALVRRSRKLLLNKASSEASHPTLSRHEEPPNNALSTKTNNVHCMQDIVHFSSVSVDPIFSSTEGFRWWPTSASPETLNEELSRRIRLMSNTWVSDVLEANKSVEMKTDLIPKTCERPSSSERKSAIKMLFEKSYNMEKLCTWFMQTTETQSLAIVKKASSRNPKEVFRYNSSRPNCKVNVCPSSQAERLRKHVKKFAKVVPKSPSMHKQAQKMLFKARSQAKRKLFNIPPFKQRNDVGQQMSRSRCTWVVYRTTSLRVRLKFRTRPRKTLRVDKAHKVLSGQMRTKTSGVPTIELLNEMPNFVEKTSTPVMKAQNAFKLSVKSPSVVKAPQKMIGITNISKENRISSKAWSPESLKECRVFLKKINSPNTQSTTEECNICTVKLYDVSPEQEETERNEGIMMGGKLESPVQLPLSPKSQSKRGGKRGKWKSCSTSTSPPVKMLRQSRSSRGVLGARWCDFVLGSLK